MNSGNLDPIVHLNTMLSGLSKGISVRGESRSLEELMATIDGDSDVEIPVVFSPEDIYMHTIAARPTFEDVKLPSKSFTYIIVNVIMVSALIAGAVLDTTTQHDGPTPS